MNTLCVFDWDGTLRRGITALDWMDFLTPVLPNAEKSAQALKDLIEDYRAGEVSYHYLVRKAAELYSTCVSDIPSERITSLADNFVQNDEKKLFDFASPLLHLLSAKGIKSILVSGAPIEVLEAYSRRLPIYRVYALEIEVREGCYTDTIHVNHGLMSKKKEVISHLLAEGYTIKLAVGNSTSDLPLLEYAEHKFLISDEQEVKEVVNASFIDTRAAGKVFTSLL